MGFGSTGKLIKRDYLPKRFPHLPSTILRSLTSVIESTQSKLYAHWFQGSQLAFVFGLDIAWGRIVRSYRMNTLRLRLLDSGHHHLQIHRRPHELDQRLVGLGYVVSKQRNSAASVLKLAYSSLTPQDPHHHDRFQSRTVYRILVVRAQCAEAIPPCSRQGCESEGGLVEAVLWVQDPVQAVRTFSESPGYQIRMYTWRSC